MKYVLLALAPLMFLIGCAQPGQNRYDFNDVGKATTVEFGTIIASKPVDITGRNTGGGALVGGAAGLGAGSYIGSGSGQAWGQAGGMLAGALIGAMIEQAIADRTGIEYVITMHDGTTRTIVQNVGPNETAFQAGERVAVQTSGNYQRVLPASQFPEKIKRPKKIKVVD